MSLTEIITHLQSGIDELQSQLDSLRVLDRTRDIRNMDLLLTRKEAAAFLCCTERHIDRMCKKGRIKKELVNGQVRLRKSECVKYLGLDFDPVIEVNPLTTVSDIRKQGCKSRNLLIYTLACGR